MKRALAALILTVTLVLSPAPADAAWGNRIVNQTTFWLKVQHEAGYTIWYAPGEGTGDVRYVIVQPGKCVYKFLWGWASASRHCASRVPNYVYVGPGRWYFK